MGRVLLIADTHFGHVHKNSVKDPNYFNVSCENVGYKPITLQEIKERLGD